jgi:alanyl-tRNA synthetase
MRCSNGGRVIVQAIEGWDPQGLKAIAVAATAANPAAEVVLFTATSPAQVVVARGASSTIDASAVLKNLAAKFGGKGWRKTGSGSGRRIERATA